MKTSKLQRNLWIFAGLCFLLSSILFLADDKALSLKSIFMVIACILAFINAYIANKKTGD